MIARSEHELAAEIFDFWLLVEEHQRSGSLRPIDEYVALFPHCGAEITRIFREEISRELDALPATGSTSAVAPTASYGSYRVTGTLGQGGQGTVFSAEDTRIKRRVALKVLSTGDVAKARILRLRREAEAIAKLDHPNICRCLEAELDGNHPFIAMSHVEGATIAECLAVAKSETARTQHRDTSAKFAALLASTAPGDRILILAVFETAARALAAAHRDGIVHRDVKPGNIMIRPDVTPVILDFGLASDLDASNQSTSEGGVGTPNYMSPEQVQGGRRIDGRSDVFSLGATLYECLTLRKPFAAPTIAGVLAAIVERDPERPRKIRPSIGSDLDAVVMTALEKSPSRRYASAEAFADDLRALCEGRPVAARTPSLIERGFRTCRRHKAASVVAVLVVLLATIGAFTIGGFLHSFRLGQSTERELDIERRLEAAFTELSLGRSAVAADDFEAIVLLSPGHVEAHAGLALALFASNRREEARRRLVESRSRGDNDVYEWVAGRLDAAEAPETRPVKTATSPSAFLAYVAGETELVLGTTGQFERAQTAIAHFRRALITSTKGRDLYRFALARAARLAEDGEAAREALVALSSRTEASKESIYHVGLAQSVIDRKAALATFEEMLRRFPGDRDALLEVAPLLADVGRIDEALARFNELKAVEPNDSMLQLTKFRIHIAGGDIVSAVREFDPNSIKFAAVVGMLARSGGAAFSASSPTEMLRVGLRRAMDVERLRIRGASPLIEDGELQRESARSLAERLDETTIKSFVRLYCDLGKTIKVKIPGPEPTAEEWWTAIMRDEFLAKVLTLRHLEWLADGMYECGMNVTAAEVYDFLSVAMRAKGAPAINPRSCARAATLFARQKNFAKLQVHLRSALALGAVDEAKVYEIATDLRASGHESAIPMIAKESAAKGIDSRRLRLLLLDTLRNLRRFDEMVLLGAETHEDFLVDSLQEFYGRKDWRSVIELGDVMASRGATSPRSRSVVIEARLAEYGRSRALEHILRMIEERRLSAWEIDDILDDWLAHHRFEESMEICLASTDRGFDPTALALRLRHAVSGILADESATEVSRSRLESDPADFATFVRYIAHFGYGMNRRRTLPSLRWIAAAIEDRPDLLVRYAGFLACQGDTVAARDILEYIGPDCPEALLGAAYYLRFISETADPAKRSVLDQWRTRCPNDAAASIWTAQYLFDRCRAAQMTRPLSADADFEAAEEKTDLETIVSCCRLNHHLRINERPFDTWETVLEGRALFLLGRIDEALAVLRHAERNEPDRAYLQLFLADLYDWTGDLDRASAAVARAIEEFDDPTSAWVERCRDLEERIRARRTPALPGR